MYRNRETICVSVARKTVGVWLFVAGVETKFGSDYSKALFFDIVYILARKRFHVEHMKGHTQACLCPFLCPCEKNVSAVIHALYRRCRPNKARSDFLLCLFFYSFFFFFWSLLEINALKRTHRCSLCVCYFHAFPFTVFADCTGTSSSVRCVATCRFIIWLRRHRYL